MAASDIDNLSLLGRYRDVLELFEPAHTTFHYGYSYKQCLDPNDAYFPVKSRQVPRVLTDGAQVEDTLLVEGCEPDTLYSWGNLTKIRAIEAQLSSSWKLSRMIYTSTFPVQTFFYGDLPIRIKLKPGVRFKKPSFTAYGGPCRWAKEGDNTVYAKTVPINSAFDTLFEFWVCTADVIESISWGTPEHFDETLKDLAWVADSTRRMDETTSYIQTPRGEKRIDINFSGRRFIRKSRHSSDGRVDGFDVSEETLISHLRSFKKFVLDGQERILYAPGVTPDREQHFRTNRPIYFNE